MSDDEKIATRYNYQYIHNVLADFYKDLLDYFADYLYPRFKVWKVMGTYQKAIEYLNKQIQYGRETDMPNAPAIIMNPSGDFITDETYGKMLWRYPNLYPGFVKYAFDPIYQDPNVIITVGFSRIKGECEFLTLQDSFYEYMDLKMFLNLVFGGIDRYIYPRYFNSFIILPSDVYDYVYENDVTGETYKINIPNIVNKLIKTTNKDEVVFPCKILPRYKITSVSDASTRFGGVDKLPDWRLTFTIEYEVEIPSFIVLETNYLLKYVNFNIKYGSCYSTNDQYNSEESVPVEVFSHTEKIDYTYDSTASVIIDPDEAEVINKMTRQFKTRYYHIVTREEAESETDINITIPEQITDIKLLLLYGKYGPFAYGDHYIISSDGWTLTINKKYVHLEEDDVLELYVYEYI